MKVTLYQYQNVSFKDVNCSITLTMLYLIFIIIYCQTTQTSKRRTKNILRTLKNVSRTSLRRFLEILSELYLLSCIVEQDVIKLMLRNCYVGCWEYDNIW